MENTKAESGKFSGDLRGQLCPPQGQPCLAGLFYIVAFLCCLVTENPGLLAIVLEKGAHSIVSAHFIQIQCRRLDEFLINKFAVSVFFNIAFGPGQQFQEVWFQVVVEQFF